jgi:hypothetical protein
MIRARQSRRFGVQLPTVCRIDGDRHDATTLNLSVHGCALTAEELPPEDAAVALEIDLLNGAPPVAVELAAVRWAAGHRCGLEFIRMAPEMAARLKAFVELLENTP